MKKLREIANEVTLISALMEGREKISTNDIIRKYPGGFTLDAVDLITTIDSTYCCVTIREDTSLFYCGGLILTKIVKRWIDEYSGDIQALNSDLRNDNVVIRLKEAKTNDGKNNIILVDIL